MDAPLIWAELNGHPFNARMTFSTLTYTLEAIDGWDSPDVDLQTVDRAESDGSFVTKGRFKHREITLAGTAWGTAQTSPWFARDELSAWAGTPRTPATLVVHDGNVDRQVSVYRSGRLKMAKAGPYAVTFELPLIAPDPRKYETVLHTATVNLASNQQAQDFQITVEGTYNTPWIATINGPITSPRFKHLDRTGQPYIAVNGTVTATYPMTLSSADRTAMMVFANRYDMIDLVLTKWFPLNAGVNNLRFARNPNGPEAASMTLQWRGAWI